MIFAALAVAMAASVAPSFDCSKANGVEHTVCAERRLAALDLRLSALYDHSLKAAPVEAAATRQAQRVWLRKRDEACGKFDAPAPCLDVYYRSRIRELKDQQIRRDESAGHAPTSGTYAGFVGRWRVVGVRAAEDAGEVTNFGADDPRYMGLELSVGAREVRWLNGTQQTGTTDVCVAPSFLPRAVATPLPAGWKAVTLACVSGQYWTEFPVAFTLKAQDLAEIEWDGGALLQLKRVAADAMTPQTRRAASPPALPQGPADGEVASDDKAYLLALQSAVRRRDRDWFARQGAIRVNAEGGTFYAYQPEEIRAVYDWIITPGVERAILTQSPDALFRNWRGVMVGGGAVWFDQVGIGGRWVYVILAINQMGHRRGA